MPAIYIKEHPAYNWRQTISRVAAATVKLLKNENKPMIMSIDTKKKYMTKFHTLS